MSFEVLGGAQVRQSDPVKSQSNYTSITDLKKSNSIHTIRACFCCCLPHDFVVPTAGHNISSLKSFSCQGLCLSSLRSRMSTAFFFFFFFFLLKPSQPKVR